MRKIELIKMPAGFPDKFKIEGLELYFTLYDIEPVKVHNNFNKEISCILSPFQVAVYDMIIGAEKKEKWDIYNECRNVFREMWPEEYRLLID